MKVFQELRTAINEWEASREAILKIAGKLQCSESEIMGKIEQLQTEDLQMTLMQSMTR